MNNQYDSIFFKKADDFFPSIAPTALTYDDVSLATKYSEVLPRQTIADTSLSEHLHLTMPIISSDMDTVTEHKMAIAMAMNGGLGIIHYNMSFDQQVKEVAKVKNYIHGLIQEPIKVSQDSYIGDVLAVIEKNKYRFRTFPVVDENNKLVGLLSGRVVKERYASMKVTDAMLNRSEVYTILDTDLGSNPIDSADKFFAEHLGVHKLLVVDKNDCLRGLFTLSDIEQISHDSASQMKATRDANFRLRCAAAMSIIRDSQGNLDKDKIFAHYSNLKNHGIDALAISTAHGFTEGVGDMVKLIRSFDKDMTIIAGNVTSAAGVEFLAKAGADAIKIGQGPGSICTTRIVSGIGIPQLTALYVCSKQAKDSGVKIIADGGITKSGDMVKALTLADAVLCGSLLAACPQAPGKILEINGKSYKQYRGMGSLAAMKDGSASRYGRELGAKTDKITAEGIEALKELSQDADIVLAQLVGGIQSGMGYMGARTLEELRDVARFCKVTGAGQKESSPHDVIEVKSSS